MRCFIAIKIPVDVRAAVEDLQRELRRFDAAVSWTRPENIHLTLKFLGEVDERLIPKIETCCLEAAGKTSEFKLRLKNTGAFPNLRNPRVLWAGLNGEVETLNDLHNRINNRLSTIGFNRDDNNFHPHLTLGRVKSNRNVKGMLAAALTYHVPAISFDVTEIFLIKSELLREGARYTEIAAFKLGNNQ